MGNRLGLAGYFGGTAAAAVLSRIGAIGAGVLDAAVVLVYLYIKLRERRAADPAD